MRTLAANSDGLKGASLRCAAKVAAVTCERYIREKKLAVIGLLAATEIVRRCERRLGELVRQGQREGTILKRGDTLNRHNGYRDIHCPPSQFFEPGHGGTSEQGAAYVMADAPTEQFERAIAEAREEGNLKPRSCS